MLSPSKAPQSTSTSCDGESERGREENRCRSKDRGAGRHVILQSAAPLQSGPQTLRGTLVSLSSLITAPGIIEAFQNSVRQFQARPPGRDRGIAGKRPGRAQSLFAAKVAQLRSRRRSRCRSPPEKERLHYGCATASAGDRIGIPFDGPAPVRSIVIGECDHVEPGFDGSGKRDSAKVSRSFEDDDAIRSKAMRIEGAVAGLFASFLGTGPSRASSRGSDN